ncbi:hypothetical protein [Parasaccharibacter sp. TMW 2.1884]|nr:hypothetical protein [Parasaccharibacter sp. TMW 2.1884]
MSSPYGGRPPAASGVIVAFGKPMAIDALPVSAVVSGIVEMVELSA